MKLQLWTFLSLMALSLASPLPTTPSSPTSQLTESSFPKRQTPLNSFISTLLNFLPGINGPIEAVSDALIVFENLLAILTDQKTTYNELSGSCKPYTVLFARGTTEPGNVGILVGPPFFQALRDRVGKGNIAIQGVNGYDADVEGYMNGGDTGGSVGMASQINAAKTKCPNTKLIIGAYSQGGQITHKAAKLISATTAAWISKVVIFGDPLSLKAIDNIATVKRKVFCHAGDVICINGALILPAHLTYAIDARAAATFATT